MKPENSLELESSLQLSLKSEFETRLSVTQESNSPQFLLKSDITKAPPFPFSAKKELQLSAQKDSKVINWVLLFLILRLTNI